ncbi:hypothetical protein BDR26DRAFT_530214 [Obelidium mucronatum]|nr:hypothetical protein BDR26DRAFT_530214 [Obelidium mucronatum]
MLLADRDREHADRESAIAVLRASLEKAEALNKTDKEQRSLQMDELKADCARVNEQLNEVKKWVAALNAAMSSTLKARDQQLAELSATVKTREKKVADLSTTVKARDTELVALKSELSNSSGIMSQQVMELAHLENQLVESDRKLKEQHEKVDQLEKSVADLEQLRQQQEKELLQIRQQQEQELLLLLQLQEKPQTQKPPQQEQQEQQDQQEQELKETLEKETEPEKPLQPTPLPSATVVQKPQAQENQTLTEQPLLTEVTVAVHTPASETELLVAELFDDFDDGGRFDEELIEEGTGDIEEVTMSDVVVQSENIIDTEPILESSTAFEGDDTLTENAEELQRTDVIAEIPEDDEDICCKVPGCAKEGWLSDHKALVEHRYAYHSRVVDVRYMDIHPDDIYRGDNDLFHCKCLEFNTNSLRVMRRHALKCSGTPKTSTIPGTALKSQSNSDASSTPRGLVPQKAPGAGWEEKYSVWTDLIRDTYPDFKPTTATYQRAREFKETHQLDKHHGRAFCVPKHLYQQFMDFMNASLIVAGVAKAADSESEASDNNNKCTPRKMNRENKDSGTESVGRGGGGGGGGGHGTSVSWTELVRTRHPTYSSKKGCIVSEKAREFKESHGLLTTPGRAFRVPSDLRQQFLEDIEPAIQSLHSQESMSVKRKKNRLGDDDDDDDADYKRKEEASDASDDEKDDEVVSWTKLVRVKLPMYTPKGKGRSIQKRARKFRKHHGLAKNPGRRGSGGSFHVPKALHEEFLEFMDPAIDEFVKARELEIGGAEYWSRQDPTKEGETFVESDEFSTDDEEGTTGDDDFPTYACGTGECVNSKVQYPSQSSLNRHRQEVHVNSVQITFSGQSDIVEIHRNEKDGLFHCPCGGFSKLSNLEKHTKTCSGIPQNLKKPTISPTEDFLALLGLAFPPPEQHHPLVEKNPSANNLQFERETKKRRLEIEETDFVSHLFDFDTEMNGEETGIPIETPMGSIAPPSCPMDEWSKSVNIALDENTSNDDQTLDVSGCGGGGGGNDENTVHAFQTELRTASVDGDTSNLVGTIRASANMNVTEWPPVLEEDDFSHLLDADLKEERAKILSAILPIADGDGGAVLQDGNGGCEQIVNEDGDKGSTGTAVAAETVTDQSNPKNFLSAIVNGGSGGSVGNVTGKESFENTQGTIPSESRTISLVRQIQTSFRHDENGVIILDDTFTDVDITSIQSGRIVLEMLPTYAELTDEERAAIEEGVKAYLVGEGVELEPDAIIKGSFAVPVVHVNDFKIWIHEQLAPYFPVVL